MTTGQYPAQQTTNPFVHEKHEKKHQYFDFLPLFVSFVDIGLELYKKLGQHFSRVLPSRFGNV